MARDKVVDFGLFVVRVGTGASFAMLFVSPMCEGPQGFAALPARPWSVLAVGIAASLVTAGIATRALAAFVAAVWLVAGGAGLLAGDDWFDRPVRAAVFAIAYAALALAGPGRFALSAWPPRASRSA